MSPMCSIMEAMAMGAMTRMAVRSNLATLPEKFCRKGWRPSTAFAPVSRELSRQSRTKSTMPRRIQMSATT